MAPGFDWDLNLQRLRWEACGDPFAISDPHFQMALRSHQLEGLSPARDYHPSPPATLIMKRGDRLRRKLCLDPRDYLLMLGCLSRCWTGLTEICGSLQPYHLGFSLAPDQEAVAWLRSPYTARPLVEAGAEHAAAVARRRRLMLSGHGWWLAADVARFTESCDYRRLGQRLGQLGLEPPLRRQWTALLRSLAPTSARGRPPCGRVEHLLGLLHWEPILPQVAALGYPFYLCDGDELHLFVDSRREGYLALERLARCLSSHGLFLNDRKTWLVETRRARRQQRLARLRLANLSMRAAALGAWVGLTPDLLVAILEASLADNLFLYRKPSWRRLLRTRAGQEALRRRLEQPDPFTGDRLLLLLYLAHSGATPAGGLRRCLQARATQVAPDSLELPLLQRSLGRA